MYIHYIIYFTILIVSSTYIFFYFNHTFYLICLLLFLTICFIFMYMYRKYVGYSIISVYFFNCILYIVGVYILIDIAYTTFLINHKQTLFSTLNNFIGNLCREFTMQNKESILIVLYILELFIIIIYFYIKFDESSYKYINKLITSTFNLNENKRISIYVDDKSKLGCFSISLWIYMNVDNNYNQNKSVSIISYNDNKPLLTYEYNEINKENNYVFQFCTSCTSDKLICTVPLQKWNNIIITYDLNTIKLYCNGILYKYSKNYTVDKFTMLHIGGDYKLFCLLKKVNYYHYTLSDNEINILYNLFL